jgi:hypothetical protein
MVTNACVPKEAPIRVSINAASASSCDLTLATIFIGLWIDGSKIENAGFSSILGQKVEFEIQSDGTLLIEN